jgi:CAAX prenyl protease-like protein
VVVLSLALWVFSRDVIDLRIRSWVGTTALGVAVFLLWIAPDVLIPGYRQHWLFNNALVGSPKGTLAPEAIESVPVLALRTLRAVVLVPIIEELFWRAWLMRWLIHRDFRSIPLGAYERSAFWITAILFASEHGSYWDVGLVTGALYNWWAVRTKSLGDLILVHAVTNACLCAYVIVARKWEYWL